jgi:flagellar biosynthesis/type III secretory pathway protein FliH
MSTHRRFAFDTDFTPAGMIQRNAPVLTQADVDAAYAKGLAEGRVLAAREAERISAEALALLATSAAALPAQWGQELQTLRQEAIDLAHCAGRAIADIALDRFGSDRVHAALEAAFDGVLRDGPRVQVRLPAEGFDAAKAALEALAQDHAYPGALIIRSEAGLRAGDVRIIWAEGLIAHDRATAFAKVEAAVTAALTDLTAGDQVP